MKYLRTGEERLMRIAYLNRMTVEEKTHSPDIGMRYFTLYFSVLPYSLLFLRNLMRSLSGLIWIISMDFIIDIKMRRLDQ